MGMGGIRALMFVQFLFQRHDFAALGFVFAFHFVDCGNGMNCFFAF
jgi:hypothetical protein